MSDEKTILSQNEYSTEEITRAVKRADQELKDMKRQGLRPYSGGREKRRWIYNRAGEILREEKLHV